MLARLHTVAAAGSLADDRLGRPHSAEAAARLRVTAEVLSASGDLPAMLVAAVAHAELAEVTNPRRVTGSLRDALQGADVFIGVSAPNILDPLWIPEMAEQSVVFALANPDPEVDPAEADKHAAVVASGRSDYPNQINNVLAFPGVFRGLLDARASEVTVDMLLRAAEAIALVVKDDELNPNFIIPTVFHPDVPKAVAAAIRGEA